MSIRNATSVVSMDRSVMLIERCLVQAGATNIAKMYSPQQELLGLVFQLNVNGVPLVFKLPARWEKVFAKMWKEIRKPQRGTEERVREQALRTAWKLLYDQVSVQVANVLIEQQDAAEAFFPYLYDGKRDATIYELARDRNFKAMIPETSGREH